MAGLKRKRTIFDIIFGTVAFFVILSIWIIFSILDETIEPTWQGFYCDDKSLRYPWKRHNAVPVWTLYIMLLAVPPVVIVCGTILEFFAKSCKKGGIEYAVKFKGFSVYCHIVKPLLWFVWYLMGLSLTVSVTIVLKMITGQLRPFFLTVCAPDFSQLNCTDEDGFPVFITDYTCRGHEGLVADARKAFPSAHSSTCAYAFLFIALYFSSFDSLPRFRSPMTFFLIILFGLFFPIAVGMSRVADYQHRFHEVVAGAAIGAAIALIVVFFHTYYFFGHSKCSTEKEKDVEKQEQEVTVAETKLST